MAKIVLDPEESAIEAFAKLFFSATRNMGFSDKEACEALKNSIEAAENAVLRTYFRTGISSKQRCSIT